MREQPDQGGFRMFFGFLYTLSGIVWKGSEFMPEEQELYRIFKETRQESLRLQAALRGFFSQKPADTAHQEAYGQYLKRRIRPAVEQLIEEEAVEKIQTLEELGYFSGMELEGFIRIARTKEKPASLMWLLQLKNEKYGYQDQDFSL